MSTFEKKHSANLFEYQKVVDESLQKIKNEKVVQRIWDHDHTIWKDDPTEISNRLGWLHSPTEMEDAIPEIIRFVDEVRMVGFTHALLLGMGGSSLAPEVFRFTFGIKEGYLDLSVLDSTHPNAILNIEKRIDISKTLFIVSTKSGGTVETMSFMKYFYNKTVEAVGSEKVGRHFVAITDPKSGLEELARKLNFRKIFLNDPNIGGRYSALSYFGLVPAALIGVDIKILLERAVNMLRNSESLNIRVGEENSGVWLGTIMGELAKLGRDKVTLITSPGIEQFGAWAEQLIAESTGKEGRGILPVDGELLVKPHEYKNDRLFVYLHLDDEDKYAEKVRLLIDTENPVVKFDLTDKYDLGGEFYRWEMAIIIAGKILGINPFDQPDVESAKVLARKMMSEFREKGKLPSMKFAFQEDKIKIYSDFKSQSLSGYLSLFFDTAKEFKDKQCYVAIQAYIAPTEETDTALDNIRTKIQKLFNLATTVGYGPRFLHSTGQLHKGDAGNGLFIQITADIDEDVPIPDESKSNKSTISFGTLIAAQALGDRQALLDGNRKVIRIDLGKDIIGGLSKIFEAIA